MKTSALRKNCNISIGYFKPIVSDKYLSGLHEYMFQFTKTGNVKLDKLRGSVSYQEKTNMADTNETEGTYGLYLIPRFIFLVE